MEEKPLLLTRRGEVFAQRIGLLGLGSLSLITKPSLGFGDFENPISHFVVSLVRSHAAVNHGHPHAAQYQLRNVRFVCARNFVETDARHSQRSAAAIRRFKCGDVEFAHLQHRLHRPLGARLVRAADEFGEP